MDKRCSLNAKNCFALHFSFTVFSCGCVSANDSAFDGSQIQGLRLSKEFLQETFLEWPRRIVRYQRGVLSLLANALYSSCCNSGIKEHDRVYHRHCLSFPGRAPAGSLWKGAYFADSFPILMQFSL